MASSDLPSAVGTGDFGTVVEPSTAGLSAVFWSSLLLFPPTIFARLTGRPGGDSGPPAACFRGRAMMVADGPCVWTMRGSTKWWKYHSVVVEEKV